MVSNANACNRQTLVQYELAKSTTKIKENVWSKSFDEKKELRMRKPKRSMLRVQKVLIWDR